MAVLSLIMVFVLASVLSCCHNTALTLVPTSAPGAVLPPGIAPAAPEPTTEKETAASEWEPWSGDLAEPV